MRNPLVCWGKIAALLGLALAAAMLTHAQGGPPATEGKTAEQVYKNIQVLKGTPADQLIQSMHLLRGALGVDCEFCHDERDRAADTKDAKATARKMMQMMIDLNKSSFNGRQVVTCYTCHQGRPQPRGVLALPVSESAEAPKVTLPSIDQILAKYVEALGGEQAIRKVTSRVITGTQYIPTGPGGVVPVPATIEVDQKTPNLMVNIYHTPTYTISNGFDGAKAWSQDMRGRVTEPPNVDQGRAKRNADFYLPLNLKQQYTRTVVRGIERVNDRDVYVVIATPQGDLPERLYFDTQTGLLVRKETALPTPLGNNPMQVNYEDYRDTGSGVKFPYLITIYPANEDSVPATSATIRVTKVQDNAPLDNAKFAKPEAKPVAAQ
jgi:photosynthetic reaction center cytochrome c subunit